MQQQLGMVGPLRASLPGSSHRAWGAPSVPDLLVPGPLPRVTLLEGKKPRVAVRGAGRLGPAAMHVACLQVS